MEGIDYPINVIRLLPKVFIAVIAIWGGQAFPARADLILNLSPSLESGAPGDTITFAGSITNTTGVSLDATDLFLNFASYDPVNIVDIEQLLGTSDFTLPNNTFSPEVDLFTVTFSPTAVPGSYPIDVTLEDINNDLSPDVIARAEVNPASAVPDGDGWLTTLAGGLVITLTAWCAARRGEYTGLAENT